MNEPLVLLPGMMCDARLFQPQTEALSSSHTIVVMPLIGRDSIEALARDILDSAPRRFALLGLSMGGIVAMEMIRQAPDRISRLALLDTNPMADAADRKDIREHQIERVKAGELQTIMRDEMKPNYLADGDSGNDILELCMLMAKALGPEVFIQQSRALKTRYDQCETLKNVQVPTLIACGEHDRLCPFEKHQLMHKLIAKSKLSMIAGAGHLPTLEQAELTNQQIRHWLHTP
ncbi:MAG: pimeloyl-ACP methyl ester carboxylesterase [Arenicella sp.]|jgi:pimeloyl-ACP methyl ester carboxylesterase